MELLSIHPQNPQTRLIQAAVASIERGEVLVYPTDSGYALGCQVGNKAAMERIRWIRRLPKEHNFTLLCRDLSHIATYARIDNPTFRYLKAHTPGPYTFILKATKEVPRRLQHPRRKTIGLRIPGHVITQAILAELAAPLMNVTLILPDEEYPVSDVQEVYEELVTQVDVIIESGSCGNVSTTVVDLTAGEPEILRIGKGDTSVL